MARSILIIVDTVFMRRLMRDVLTREGFDVREAAGGSDALAAFIETHPDLVISDLGTAGGDEGGGLARIVAHDPTARVLLAGTAAEDEGIRQASRLGACGYLPTPFQPSRLVESVRSALRPEAPQVARSSAGRGMEERTPPLLD